MHALFARSSHEATGFAAELQDFVPDTRDWGVAIYDGAAARLFKEARTPSTSPLFHAALLASAGSRLHLGQMAGNIGSGHGLSDVAPFERELGGRSWTFVHDGDAGAFHTQLIGFRPIGSGGPEAAFCALLDTARDYLSSAGEITDPGLMVDRLCRRISEFTPFGEFNILMSDGVHLFAHAHGLLYAHERPDSARRGADLRISTCPLSDDPGWDPLPRNTLSLYRDGALIARQSTTGSLSPARLRIRQDECDQIADRRRKIDRWAQDARLNAYESG